MFNKSKIKKVLVISLTNIGDIILTFPVLDILRAELPQAELSVVIGPKGEPLLQNNPHIHKVHIFDKRQPLAQTVELFLALRKERFDLVVDLRNSAMPFFLGARHITSPVLKRVDGEHMRLQHLRRLKSVFLFNKPPETKFSLHISPEDKTEMDRIIREEIGGDHHSFVVVAPGAADIGKRWPSENFGKVCDALIEKNHFKIVFVGDAGDRKKVQRVTKKMHHHGVNLSGRVSLTQLAYLLQQGVLLITNDSAPMHLASYLDAPVLGLFGPTDPAKYGPWGKRPYFLKGKAEASATSEEKMAAIGVEEVIAEIGKMIVGSVT